jgi:hypothetical protein
MPRKSQIQLAGESGLRNLDCIRDLAQEARELGGGTRDYRATFFRNESECKRWLAQMQAAAMPCPDYITTGFPSWGYE